MDVKELCQRIKDGNTKGLECAIDNDVVCFYDINLNIGIRPPEPVLEYDGLPEDLLEDMLNEFGINAGHV